MTAGSYTTTPIGKIVNRGEPVINVEKKLTASAKAGMLAVTDGNDYKVKPSNGTAKPIGWIGYEHTDYKFRPADYDTAYAIWDTVGIVAGGDFEIYALVTASSAVTINTGDILADNGDGTLKLRDPASSTDFPIAMAVESKSLESGTVARIAVLTLI